jgi:hypothetical protein
MLGIEGKGLSLMISFEMNDNLVTEINFLPDTDFVDIKGFRTYEKINIEDVLD